MNKSAKILTYIWMGLAAMSLFTSFFLPNMAFQIINWVFGGMNVLAGTALHILLKEKDGMQL